MRGSALCLKVLISHLWTFWKALMDYLPAESLNLLSKGFSFLTWKPSGWNTCTDTVGWTEAESKVTQSVVEWAELRDLYVPETGRFSVTLLFLLLFYVAFFLHIYVFTVCSICRCAILFEMLIKLLWEKKKDSMGFHPYVRKVKILLHVTGLTLTTYSNHIVFFS